jgi:23S rRNA (guanosine2251-2'-O)-methyltransferase
MSQLIYGRHPIFEAIQAGKEIEVLYIEKDLKGPGISEIRQAARELELPVKSVPREKLDYIARNKNHQGVVGLLAMIKYFDKEDILNQAQANGEQPLFLILDHITDVRNFGAIARTAYGTGVHAILVPQKGGALINSDALKTSAGALNHVKVCREIDLVQTIKWCKANGIHVLVSDLKASKNLSQIEFDRPMAIVLGEEGIGVNQLIINRADETFKIPINKGLDSYTVSVAAGMILYERMRSME